MMSPFGFVTGDSKSLPSLTVRSAINVGSERPKREDFMIARRLVQLTFRWRTILLALLATSSVACSTMQECDSPCDLESKSRGDDPAHRRRADGRRA